MFRVKTTLIIGFLARKLFKVGNPGSAIGPTPLVSEISLEIVISFWTIIETSGFLTYV